MVLLWNGTALSVVPPNFVVLEIVETDPGVRGEALPGSAAVRGAPQSFRGSGVKDVRVAGVEHQRVRAARAGGLTARFLPTSARITTSVKFIQAYKREATTRNNFMSNNFN